MMKYLLFRDSAFYCLIFIAITFSNPSSAQHLAGAVIDFKVRQGETFDYATLSPDGNTFVYVTSRPNRPNSKIYSIPSSGNGNAVSLNTGVGRVRSVQISPDNSRVIFIDEDLAGVTPTLVSVPINGGDITRLSAEPFFPPIAASFLRNVQFSPDGRKVLFEHTRRFQEYELFSNDIEGGAIANLNLPPLGLNTSFHNYQISPNSSFVVYSPNLPSNSTDPQLLFRTPTNGNSQPTQLTPPGQIVSSFRFVISPDSQHVAYTARTNESSEYKLFSQLSSGGNATELGSQSSTNEFDFTYWITPDSSTVVLGARTQSNLNALSRIPITGGTELPISSARPNGLIFSLDGQSFYYLDSSHQLYSYSLSRNTSNRVTDKLLSALSIQETKDGSRLLFYTSDMREFFSVKTSGQNLQRLNHELDIGHRLLPYKTPEQRNLVAFQTIDNTSISRATRRDLFIASPTTGDELSVGSGFIQKFEIFDNTLFYLSDEINNQPQWFRVGIPEKFGIESENDLCIPVKSKDNKIALICL